MPCGCVCAKVKTKFLLKFSRPCSGHKQGEKRGVQKPKQTERRKIDEGTEAEIKPGHDNPQKEPKSDEYGVNEVTCEADSATPMSEIQEANSLQVRESTNKKNGETCTEEEKDEDSAPNFAIRRASTHIDRLRNLLKPKNRRDAICDEMERKIEPNGVSLRQYRKFLATSSVLQELKML